MIEFWQTTELDHAIAEEFFGWKWMAFRGIPVRGTKDYPTKQIVRQFFPPKSLENPEWIEFLAKNEGRRADGSEPLSYRYCSSVGPASVPHFSGHDSAIADLERELRRRGLWTDYRNQLWVQVTQQTDDMQIEESTLADADHKSRCIAGLALVDSRFLSEITRDESSN